MPLHRSIAQKHFGRRSGINDSAEKPLNVENQLVKRPSKMSRQQNKSILGQSLT
jgi:hypothetical protein